MKKHAVLINTARGGLVDEEALFEALKRKKLRAAALDVLQKEPPENCPLIGLENCVVTPHVAWAAAQTRNRLVIAAADNLRAFIEGKEQNKIV